MATATSSTKVKDPEVNYETCVFVIPQLRVRCEALYAEVKAFTAGVTGHQVTVKEDRLQELRKEYGFWVQKLGIACSYLKDAQVNYDSQLPGLTAIDTALEKAQMRLGHCRDLINKNAGVTKTASTSSSTTVTSHHQFKLERIKLPTFSGKFSEWEEFRDLFTSAVDNNTVLTGAEKLVYLKTTRIGDALSIVSSFPTSDTSYASAWELVKARFANPREIAFSHLRKLFDLPTAHDSARDIRKVTDTVQELTRSLHNLKVPVDHWDVILVFWTLRKVDSEIRREWLLTQGTQLPTLTNLIDFLEKRATALDDSVSLPKPKDFRRTISKSSHSTTVSNPRRCADCAQSHPLHLCEVFVKRSVSERNEIVKKAHLCFNCLARGHGLSSCKSKFSCRTCNLKHHSLLHQEHKAPSLPQVPVSSSVATEESTLCAASSTSSAHVLLETAQVDVIDSRGEKVPIRVFIDQGSEAEFVTESCIQKLGFYPRGHSVKITGIGGTSCGSSVGRVCLTLHSKVKSFTLKISAEVIPTLTRGTLLQIQTTSTFPHLKGLVLADPEFWNPQPVDVILGARHASRIKLGAIIHGLNGAPSAEKTHFGWILSGPITVSNPSAQVAHLSASTTSLCLEELDKDSRLQLLLSKFWEMEEPDPQGVPRSTQDQLTEEHFSSTVSRESDGRYIVSLPFRDSHVPLKNSLSVAVERFHVLERRLQKNPWQLTEYKEYFDSHIKSGMIERIPSDEISCDPQSSYYVPYTEVRNKKSSTTKVRVVFDCSAKTINAGPSLNDLLYSGPKLQVDLVPLLIRFRTYPYVFSADIVRFFNQILLAQRDRDFQRLVWRDSGTQPLEHLRWRRLCFGLTCAPFLAIRSLQQLFSDEKTTPEVQRVLQEDVLVDNILTGAFTVDAARIIQQELIRVMPLAQFRLRKWASNVSQLLEEIPVDDREVSLPLTIASSDTLSTLGLIWYPALDVLTLSLPQREIEAHPSKRRVLSQIAKIFDPMGWVSPVTVRAKIFLQDLWREKVDWDTPIAPALATKWKAISIDLSQLSQFSLPRSFSMGAEAEVTHELFGFSDASNLAYAAVVYLRTKTDSGQTFIGLVGAKTKVSPVKGETIPRLELCGARLLTSFLKSILEAIRVPVSSINCFSDSTSVIAWLNSDAQRQNRKDVFVLNRIRFIRQSLPKASWHHVSGSENPADFPSRGISAKDFLFLHAWKCGPLWLRDFIPPNHMEVYEASIPSDKNDDNDILVLIYKISSLERMKRVVATVRRFASNLKTKIKVTSPLSALELESALRILVLAVQRQTFSEEIHLLASHSKKAPEKLNLSPFLIRTESSEWVVD